MIEDISFVEQYFGIETSMLDAEGVVSTKTVLERDGWWTEATLEEVLSMLYERRNT